MSELPALEAATVDVAGRPHMANAAGHLVDADMVKDQDKLEDQTVRALFGRALAMTQVLRAFRVEAFNDVDSFLALLDERYGAKKGGEKGNLTLTSFDGLFRVQVQVADLIQFGGELQAAKALMDECVADWSINSNVELCALVVNAFRLDKGKINRGALLGLQRVDWKDERAIRAMEAIKDSIRVVGSKRYIRFSWRANPKAAWESVSLDVATA